MNIITVGVIMDEDSRIPIARALFMKIPVECEERSINYGET
jgi:hypothetical protein